MAKEVEAALVTGAPTEEEAGTRILDAAVVATATLVPLEDEMAAGNSNCSRWPQPLLQTATTEVPSALGSHSTAKSSKRQKPMCPSSTTSIVVPVRAGGRGSDELFKPPGIVTPGAKEAEPKLEVA